MYPPEFYPHISILRNKGTPPEFNPEISISYNKRIIDRGHFGGYVKFNLFYGINVPPHISILQGGVPEFNPYISILRNKGTPQRGGYLN
jgi:hypothetical protein